MRQQLMGQQFMGTPNIMDRSIMGHKAMRGLALTAGMAMLLALPGCTIFHGNGKGSKTPVIGERVSILNNATGIEVDPTLSDVAVSLPPADNNDEWSQPGGNPSKAMGNVALGEMPTRI